MCRLFGFRSIHHDSIANHLVEHDNSLSVQSREHRDGWGIAYFHHGIPHVFRSIARAGDDPDFVHLAKTLSVNFAITHLRRATQGELRLINCHPFQYGNWIFAHNGDLPEWPSLREELRQKIAPRLLSSVLGDTDSEVYFALFLTELNRKNLLGQNFVPMPEIAQALRTAAGIIEEVYVNRDIKKRYALNAMVANGDALIGYRQGHKLCYRIEEAGPEKAIERLTICSEPHTKDCEFVELRDRQMVGIDGSFHFYDEL